MSKGISVRDLEELMRQKASHVSPYTFDPETGSWTRQITFKLNTNPKRKRALKGSSESADG